jgi:hypothetical protein
MQIDNSGRNRLGLNSFYDSAATYAILCTVWSSMSCKCRINAVYCNTYRFALYLTLLRTKYLNVMTAIVSFPNNDKVLLLWFSIVIVGRMLFWFFDKEVFPHLFFKPVCLLNIRLIAIFLV